MTTTERPRVLPPHLQIELDFSCGHRVLADAGTCGQLHGHSFTASLACSAIRGGDRRMDSRAAQQVLAGWIEREWEGAMLLDVEDTEALTGARMIHGQRVYRMHTAPTLAAMAAELLTRSAVILAEVGIRVDRLRLAQGDGRSAIEVER